jgi:hypothetical protein
MRRFRTQTLALVVLLAGSVLGLLTLDAGGTTKPSGLYGQVHIGPITPVCTAEQPCDAPAPRVTLVFSRADRELGRTVTRTDGTYRIRLAPGVYGVSRALRAARPVEPETARVPTGRYARVDFSIDTGIR